MLLHTIHAISCAVLAVAAVYWFREHPSEPSAYRFLLPFVITSGVTGIVIAYHYGIEFFIASYSGSIHEPEVSRGMIALNIIFCVLTILPLTGLLPLVGHRALPMILIGIISLIPSAYSLALHHHKHQPQTSADVDNQAKPGA